MLTNTCSNDQILLDNSSHYRIVQAFNKAAATYTEHSQIQLQTCNSLIELLEPNLFHFQNIADFACGTGISTKNLIDAYGYNQYYAIDFAAQALLVAKNKLAEFNVNFIIGNYNTRQFSNKTLDLAFSNLGFNWSTNLAETFKMMFKQLKRGGILAFSVPIDGNFKQLKKEFRNRFYRSEEILVLLQDSGFLLNKFHILTYDQLYENAFIALKSLKNTGTNVNLDNPITGLISFRKLNQMFENPEQISLTYKIGLFVATKL
jgi:malonyl-CoA O-methyltransferase